MAVPIFSSVACIVRRHQALKLGPPPPHPTKQAVWPFGAAKRAAAFFCRPEGGVVLQEGGPAEAHGLPSAEEVADLLVQVAEEVDIRGAQVSMPVFNQELPKHQLHLVPLAH